MLNMDSALPTLIKTRPNFYREQSSLMYVPGAYILANIVVELPWLLLVVLTGSTVRVDGLGEGAGRPPTPPNAPTPPPSAARSATL